MIEIIQQEVIKRDEEGRLLYKDPAVGRCVCGEEVTLGEFTCPCRCGRDYNWAGQELAPRSQWGEETGESYADIVAPGDPFEDW